MGDRVILHSDINCCYASIEHLHHPELAGKPLAVGGDPQISEWGNPAGKTPVIHTPIHNVWKGTR